ncbi:MAG: substrate-binding domain-containing protein [Pseudomonadota bacterium]
MKKRVLFFPQWVDFDVERGVLEYAREAGWQLLGLAHHGADLHVARSLRLPNDGMIVLARHRDLAEFIESSAIPVVDLADTLYWLQVHRVLMDDVAIGRMAGEHLIQQGLPTLAFLQTLESAQSRDRACGLAEVAAQYGRAFHRLKLIGVDSQHLALDLARQIKRLPRPLGIMINHDIAAWMIVEACNLAGLGIPDEVAVIGVGNTESVSGLLEVGLTSVEDNHFRQGYEAAALLDRLMNGEQCPLEPVRIAPTHVVVRKSTDALAAANHSVQSALNFIRENFRDPDVHVEQVVAASGMSRRRLYTLFKQHLDMGVNEVIMKMRVNEAKRLLVETDSKAFAVAVQAGFRSDEHLIRTFSRVVGATPRQFRRQRPPTAPA